MHYPDSPEGVAFIVWIAALAAGYDSRNEAKIATLLNLFAEVRKTVDGDRPEDMRAPH